MLPLPALRYNKRTSNLMRRADCKAYLENTYSVSLYTFASVVLVKTDVCVHKLVKRYSKAVMCSTHGVN